MPKLDHANHEGLTLAKIGDELRFTVTVTGGADGADGADGVGVPAGGSTGQVLKKATAADYDTAWASEAATILEAVAGGAGFVDTSGAVTLDLSTGRAFHHTMTGNITGLTFANVPAADEHSAAWTWVLRVDGDGPYSFAGEPTVTFVDGRGWSSMNLNANKTNIFTFWRVGAITYAALVWSNDLPLDSYKVCFVDGEETTLVVLTEYEEIDAGNVTKYGDGTITLTQNGGATITTRTAFDAGDRLGIQLSSGMGTTVAVSIPRYAR